LTLSACRGEFYPTNNPFEKLYSNIQTSAASANAHTLSAHLCLADPVCKPVFIHTPPLIFSLLSLGQADPYLSACCYAAYAAQYADKSTNQNKFRCMMALPQYNQQRLCQN
jgi:hypothetical protein